MIHEFDARNGKVALSVTMIEYVIRPESGRIGCIVSMSNGNNIELNESYDEVVAIWKNCVNHGHGDLKEEIHTQYISKPPKGFVIIKNGKTKQGDQVWDISRDDWSSLRVDTIGHDVSKFFAVCRSEE